MATPTAFKSYSDSGHGWAAVKRDFLTYLGILGDITRFSYQRGATVYLEEDCDVSTFVNAYTAKYGKAPEFPAGKYKDTSPIRSYASFDATRDPRDDAAAFAGLKVGDTITLGAGFSIPTLTVVAIHPYVRGEYRGSFYRIKAGHVTAGSVS